MLSVYFHLFKLRDIMFNSNGSSISIADGLASHFGIVDYVVFILMLVICSCIGLLFGYRDHKKHNKKGRQRDVVENEQALDYLLGGRNMQIVPVAMSLIASGLSGITLLGMPTETYIYGWSFWYICVPVIITGIFTNYVVIPLFFELQIVSVNEVYYMTHIIL